MILLLMNFVFAATTETCFKVEGMTCGSCKGKVERSVSAMEGVSSIEVDLASDSAKVVFDDDKASSEKISEVINGRGYKASVKPCDT